MINPVDSDLGMGRSILYSIGIIVIYGSMTCVHIPYGFRKPALLTGNSAFLMADFSTSDKRSEQEEISKSHFMQEPDNNSRYRFMDNTDPVSDNPRIKIDNYNIPVPKFMRGIYLSNGTANSKNNLLHMINQAKVYHINTFVVDVQNNMIPREYLKLIKQAGIFPVARIVVFLGGLRTKSPSAEYVDQILELMDAAAYQGFLEVQLDYIRYADSKEMESLPLDFKYQTINKILEKTQVKADSLSIFLSADLFGRVTLNENDQIGQRLENFSRYTDTIYPMLYPSHYTNDEYRIAHPYETVKEGVEKSMKRCRNTKIVAYIQGFPWKIESSGKSLSQYIQDQIAAVDDAGGHGWIIWNAKNEYTQSFHAIKAYYSGYGEKISGIKNNRAKIL